MILVVNWKEKFITFQKWSKQGKELSPKAITLGLFFCILLALGLRLLSWYIEPVISRDGCYYIQEARRLLADNYDQKKFGSNTVLFYISYLASHLFYLKPHVLAIVTNIVLGSLLPLVLFGIAKQMLKDREVALATAFICAVHPTLIKYSIEVQREIIYLFPAALFFLSIVYFWNTKKWYWNIAAAFSATSAMFFRYEGFELFLIAFIVYFLSFWRAKEKRMRSLFDPSLFLFSTILCTCLLLLLTPQSPLELAIFIFDKLKINAIHSIQNINKWY